MKRSAAITTLMVTLGLLSACTPEADPTPSPTPSATSAAPTPTPSETPTSASPEPSSSPSPSETLDADQRAARDVVNDFFRIQQALKQDPSMPMQALADITTETAQDVFLAEVIRIREEGLVQTGDVSWSILDVGNVTSAGGARTVQVQACTDNSNIDVIDQDSGDSVLTPDRIRIIDWTILVVTVNGHWLIAEGITSAGSECPQ